MAWAPQPAGLQEILQTIHESTDSQNPQVQKNITHVSCPPSSQRPLRGHLTRNRQKLNQFTRAPDYIAYLAYILAALPQEEDRVRSIAGYLLKNNSRLIMQTSAQVAEFTKASLLQAFTDSSVMIRNAAGHATVALLGTLEPRQWPQCLEQLFAMLDSPDPDIQEVSLRLNSDSKPLRLRRRPFFSNSVYRATLRC
jgi:transportin-1